MKFVIFRQKLNGPFEPMCCGDGGPLYSSNFVSAWIAASWWRRAEPGFFYIVAGTDDPEATATARAVSL